jgi:V8-like Glu-specific endopeptidase
MIIDRYQIEATRQRFEERRRQRNRNLELGKRGHYLQMDSPDRVEKFLLRRGYSPQQAAKMITSPQPLAAAAESVGQSEPSALERILGTSDLMAVAFLDVGLTAARTVGRVWIGVAAGRPIGFGTGFMVSPSLLMTNHHVLGDKNLARTSLVEFDYQLKSDGTPRQTASFAMDPDTFHIADRDLDYAVVAVRPNSSDNSRSLSEFGYNRLIEAEGKTIAGQWVNIIQHPNGEPKQLALRENNVVDVLENFIQYQTDTAPGSSGSPVYNDQWEVVALHHSGVWATNAAGQILAVDGQVWRDDMGEDRIKWIANEGVRISRILKHIRTLPLSAAQQGMFEAMTADSTQPGTKAVVSTDSNQVRSQSTGSGSVPSVGVATVASDGTATWTIPISVSIRVGQFPTVPPQVISNLPTPVSVTPSSDTDASPNSILREAQKAIGDRTDVLNIKLGYVFRNGWITKERAIVVTVRRRQSQQVLHESAIDPLPETFRGMPVEVTNPTLRELVRLMQGPDLEEAIFGEDVAGIAEEITYTPPHNAPPLDPITDDMHVIAHVSPDNGWPQLKNFLKATKKRLVVGMYDFGAQHIVDAVKSAGGTAQFEKMTMAIQKGQDTGSGTKVDDLTDQQTIDEIRAALGPKFESAFVKIGPVNGWVAYSYHIKVAVRDHKAFWLSSGNWQSSNQPDADPLHEVPQVRHWLTEYNREWHAIVEHAGLAKTFEAYLLNDYEANKTAAPNEAVAMPNLLLPGGLLVPTPEETAKPFQYFAPFDKRRRFTVRPLLTPDNFRQHVLALIKSAQTELLIQNQTFNNPADGQDALAELVDAALARQRAGVDVRIIFRLFMPADARDTVTGLVDRGFSDKSIKVQTNCHTKGIIVDRKHVVCGSQNWSNTGVSDNRDASLMFDDAELANYFADIFEHDWKNLAKYNIGNESLAVEILPAGGVVPSGMTRIGWKDVQEML